MKIAKHGLLVVAAFQILSTLSGALMLVFASQWFAPVLDPTPLAGQYDLAAILLGVVVGGLQWVAVFVHLRRPRWLPLAHTAAGTMMIGWIFGECLVINAFVWFHAFWGGLGVLQLLLVLVALGVLQPQSSATRTAGITGQLPARASTNAG